MFRNKKITEWRSQTSNRYIGITKCYDNFIKIIVRYKDLNI